MKNYFYMIMTVLAFIGVAVLCELQDEGIITAMQWFWWTFGCELTFLFGLYKLRAFIFQKRS